MELLGVLVERGHFVNLLFGITFINLTIVGVFTLTLSCTFLSMVRLSVVLCNLIMGVMLISNKHFRSVSSPLYKPYWLSMIVCNIVVIKLVDESFPVTSIAFGIYLVGYIILMLSLGTLRDSFAVTPMVSSIKTNLLYGFVRHPMYLGESIMLLSCVVATSSPVSILVLIAFGVSMCLRIKEEERVLSLNQGYESYCSKVRWRLLPHVW